MASTVLEASSQPAQSSARRPGALALTLQEVFTAVSRLRTDRQVAADAESFRLHVKQLLGAADREARRIGYDAEQVRLAVFAVVALVDEAVLNSRQPIFAAWPRQPLQEEIFGEHMAGETFFVHLQDLLRRQDSADLADLLEVYQLCLLLGFRGRYAAADERGIHTLIATVREKIQRIRAESGALSPEWSLPSSEVIASPKDPWMRRLSIAAIGSAVTAVIVFVVYRLSLHGLATEIQTVANQLAP